MAPEASGASAGPILVCYDGSDPAKDAVARAGKLLAPAPAVVLHVWLPLSHVMLWNPFIGSPGPLDEPAAELDAAGREAAQRLADEGAALAREAGLDAEAVIAESRHGAWRTAVAFAEEHDVRVVVAGSHGMSPVASVLLGSVANGIVSHSRRPVLVVPARRE